MSKTTLIARDGYGGNYTAAGASDYMLAPGARLYVGPHGRPEESMGLSGWLGKVTSAIKSGASGALDFYKGSQQTAGQAQAYQSVAMQAASQQPRSSGLPSWVLPVGAVAGVGLLALVLLKKKRKNPARPRRRTHRRRR